MIHNLQEKYEKQNMMSEPVQGKKTFYLTNQQQYLHTFPDDNIQNICCTYRIIHVHTISSHCWIISYGAISRNLVTRHNDYTNCLTQLLIYMLLVLWQILGCCNMYIHLFQGTLKPASMCMVDTLNICLYKYL